MTPTYGLSDHLLGDCQISPRADAVVCVRGANYIEGHPQVQNHLWLLRSGKKEKKLTKRSGNYGSPRWANRRTAIVFVSDFESPGTNRPYLYDFNENRLRNLYKGKPIGAVEQLRWSADDRAIYALVTKPGASTSVEIDETPGNHSRLYRIDLKSRHWEPISPEGVHVWEYDVAASGDAVVIYSESSFENEWYRARLGFIDDKKQNLQNWDTGPLVRRDGPGFRQISVPRFSPDGLRLALLVGTRSDRDVVSGALAVIDRKIPQFKTWGVPDTATTYDFAWDSDGKSIVALNAIDHDFTLQRMFEVAPPQTIARFPFASIADPFAPQISYAAAAKRVALRHEGPELRRELLLLSTESNQPVANPRFTKVPSRVKPIEWKSTDGRTLYGKLWVPGKGERPRPTAIFVHGGPTYAFTDFNPEENGTVGGIFEALLNEGFAVFSPNFRGSTGRGREFAELNLGDVGGKDWLDIESGVDAIVKMKLADPKRLGLIGWSYGGFIAGYGITQTDRYRVAVAGAGIFDWASFAGTTNIANFVRLYLTPNLVPAIELVAKRSAINYVDKIKTPLLIIHGGRDEMVPPSQAQIFSRALAEMKKEHRLVILKDAPHGPRQKRDVVAVIDEIRRWFSKLKN